MRARYLIVLLALTPALAACGGSSSPGAATTDQQLTGELASNPGTIAEGAPSAPTASEAAGGTKAAAGAAQGTQKAARPDPVSATNHTARARHGSKTEQRGTGIKPLNPCTLVTRAEASAIVGRPVAALRQAPQGPTCIYQVRSAKSLITMAVQNTPFTPPKSAKDVARVTLRGHKAYCVKRAGLVMVVPLAAGHVLNVAAPCPVAAGFAAKALARLYP